MRLWRICKTKYAKTPLDGLGGTLSSARLHVRGTRIVYSSTTPSLAALECLVYVDPSEVPDLTLIEISVPETASVEYCEPEKLSPDWRAFPHPEELQVFGSTWVREARSLLLRVPSAVMSVDLEGNFLMNPAHVDAGGVRIASVRPFSFHGRLL